MGQKAVFTKELPVIGGDNDDARVEQTCSEETCKQLPESFIHKGNLGVIGWNALNITPYSVALEKMSCSGEIGTVRIEIVQEQEEGTSGRGREREACSGDRKRVPLLKFCIIDSGEPT